MISQRITRLKKELQEVRRTRNLGRKSRERVPFPVVSLVGYTNAGKSTLFNKMTDAGVFAKDLLFATLDPTMRKIKLPNKQEVILADTVGFISDLPTHLVEAFRATLEQISYADVILHVIDVSRHDYMQQRQDVAKILCELGIDYENDERIIEVYNKIDMLSESDLSELKRKCKFADYKTVNLSALTGEGGDRLLKAVSEITAAKRKEAVFDIKPEDGKAIAWLYGHGDVISKESYDKFLRIHVFMDKPDLKRFKKIFSYPAKRMQKKFVN